MKHKQLLQKHKLLTILHTRDKRGKDQDCKRSIIIDVLVRDVIAIIEISGISHDSTEHCVKDAQSESFFLLLPTPQLMFHPDSHLYLQLPLLFLFLKCDKQS